MDLDKKCPACDCVVEISKYLQENDSRRGVFTCPSCGTRFLRCLTPGCQNYARGGIIWDDNLCPDCTRALPKTVVMDIAASTIADLIALFHQEKK